MTPDASRPPRPAARKRRGAWHLSDFFPYHLSFTAELLSAQLARLVHAQAGLTMPEWRVMTVIGSFAPLAAKKVAAHTSMNKVAVSRAIARLQASGYVAREPDDADNRLLRLELTATGRKTFLAVTASATAWSEAVTAALSEEELRTMKRLLARLRTAARSMEPGEAAPDDVELFGDCGA